MQNVVKDKDGHYYIKIDEKENCGLEFEQFFVKWFLTKNEFFHFEDYRRDWIIPTKETQSSKNKISFIYPESSQYPDLLFYFKPPRIDFQGQLISKGTVKYRFAIECKFCKEYPPTMEQFMQKKQFTKYVEYQKVNNIPVMIALGVGGIPSDPEYINIFPLEFLFQWPLDPIMNVINYCFYQKDKSFYTDAKIVFNPSITNTTPLSLLTNNEKDTLHLQSVGLNRLWHSKTQPYNPYNEPYPEDEE